MKDASPTNSELREEISALKRRLVELEHLDSDRKRAEEAIQRSETKYRTLYDSTSEAVMLISDKIFFDCNKATLTIFGCETREDFCRKHPAELSPPRQPCGTDSMALANRMIAAAMEKGSIQFEWVHRRYDTGGTFPAEVLLTAMELDGKTVIQAVVRDITKRKAEEGKNRNIVNFLQILLNTIPSPIFCKDIHGRYQDCNKEFENYTGFKKEELIGKGVYDMYPREVADKYHEMDLALFREPGRQIYEHPIVYADGEKRDVVVNKATYLNADGTVAGLVGVMVDITDRKKTEEALRRALLEVQRYHEQLEHLVAERTAELRRAYSSLEEREARFRSYFELPLHGIAITSPEKGWLEVNDRVCSIMGYSRDEIIGMTWLDMTHPADLAADVEQFNRLLSGQIEQYTMDKRFIRKDGTVVWTSLAVGCVRRPDGGVNYIIALLEDITERKETQEALRRLNEELEAKVLQRTSLLESANRELESFSYSVSHDLKAPLRAIDGYARILIEDHADRLDDEGRRTCNVIISNARKMGRLIDALLVLSRTGRIEMNTAPVNMTYMANTAFLELTGPGERERIDFHIASLPDSVGDPTLLRQVWMNLIGNAIKFSAMEARAVIEVGFLPAGSHEADISTEHEPPPLPLPDSAPVYFVRDNGAGFDMAYADRLFAVFQRLHSAKEYEGTGAGLAIVKRIIQRHGGRIWAKGEKGKGATFYFSIGEACHNHS